MSSEVTAQLSDAELLALLLAGDSNQRRALAVAEHLLTTHGSIKNLLDQPLAQIHHLQGVSQAKFKLLHAALELSQRYLQQEITQLAPREFHS